MRKLLAILLRLINFPALIIWLLIIGPILSILLLCEIIYHGDTDDNIENNYLGFLLYPMNLWDLAKKIENEKI